MGKNYPKGVPGVEEAARILPTLRNLIEMSKGKAPFAENSRKKLQLHHYTQKMNDLLILLDPQEHRHKEYHDSNKKSEIDRNKFDNQREMLWEWWAKSYLGRDLVEAFKNLNI